LLVIEKAHDALPLDDASRTVARPLSPLHHLVKPQAMLDGRAVDGDHKFSHRPHLRGKLVGAECGMPLVSVNETLHRFMGQLYSFVFCSPTELFEHIRDKAVQLLACRSVHGEIPDVPASGSEM